MGRPSGREELDPATVVTLWSGRFDEPMDGTLWDLSESYSFDAALYAADIDGSMAHVKGLVASGLMSADEGETVTQALATVRREFDNAEFVRGPHDEDIHMAIERRVTELAGPAGAKLHTGRSRNDQVATALRLYTRDAVTRVAHDCLGLVDVLVDLADRYATVVMPGYTHLQRAQSVLFSHHVQAHAWSLLRDVDRLLDARDRMNVSPLGAGAMGGSSLPLNPRHTASIMGFEEPFANSMDAVSDRDFVAETLFALALCGVHASRMGEEIVLWTSAEFGFASLGDAFTTGSSMLPQKKNSDVAELARGKSGRLVGNLTGLLVMLKGLPLAYNRDLQEDKEPLFDSVRTMTLVLRALSGAYASMSVHEDAMAAAAGDELLVAIDLAERLVERGVPFREAHERIGNLVGRAVATGVTLESLVAQDAELQEFQGLFAPGASLAARRSPGGGGPENAPEQRKRLESRRRELGDRLTR